MVGDRLKVQLCPSLAVSVHPLHLPVGTGMPHANDCGLRSVKASGAGVRVFMGKWSSFILYDLRVINRTVMSSRLSV